MVLGTLALSAVLHYVMAGAFATVALGLVRRVVDPRAVLPMRALAAWWGLLAASTGLAATTDVLAAVGATDVAVFATASDANAMVAVAALAALVYYLLYLFTGRQAVAAATVFFAVVLAVSLYNNNVRVPVGVELRAWDTVLVFANPDAGVPRAVVFLIALLPPVVGAIGMLALYPRAPGPTERFRLVLVAGSILVWFGSVVILGAFAGLEAHPLFGLLARLLGVGAAAAAYLAYFPPLWVQRRLGVRSLRGPPPPDRPAAWLPREAPSGPPAER